MEEVKKQGLESLFVGYNKALALKELGFDEPCFGNWQDMKEINPWLSNSYTISQNQYYGQLCSAPTYSQAFRWFREKYKLIAYPQWRIDNTWDITIQQLDGYGLLSGQTTLSVIKKSTYEEAELECLKKLIEIVKNGKSLEHSHEYSIKEQSVDKKSHT